MDDAKTAEYAECSAAETDDYQLAEVQALSAGL
jgi:hypothetical protein